MKLQHIRAADNNKCVTLHVCVYVRARASVRAGASLQLRYSNLHVVYWVYKCVLCVCTFRRSHVAQSSDLLRTTCAVLGGTASAHQPPGSVPRQECLVRGQEHHTDSRAHRMSAAVYPEQVRRKIHEICSHLVYISLWTRVGVEL